MRVFTLVQATAKQVVLKVNAEDNLTVALHPYISREYDYITVTRGKNHILTIIRQNGSTFSFHWGESGHTLISDNLQRLKREVCNFIADCGIILDDDSGEIRSAKVYFNDNFGKWQLTINDHGYHWSKTATTVEEMINEAEKFGVKARWEKRKAPTGITVWHAIL